MIDTNCMDIGHGAYQNLSSLELGSSNQMMNWTELVVYMQGWWTHLKVSENRKKNLGDIFEKSSNVFLKVL